MGMEAFQAGEDLSDKLEDYSKRTGVSKSLAIRKALENWPPLNFSGLIGFKLVVFVCSGRIEIGGMG